MSVSRYLCVLIAVTALSACYENSPSSAESVGFPVDGGGGESPSQDTDADGIANNVDNCPQDSNPGQENADFDDLGDACDPEDNRDSDGDNVGNESDLCADTSAGESVDDNGCAVNQTNASCGDSVASVTANRQ
jgi:ABC-2 type transport system ATP-binding protein